MKKSNWSSSPWNITISILICVLILYVINSGILEFQTQWQLLLTWGMFYMFLANLLYIILIKIKSKIRKKPISKIKRHGTYIDTTTTLSDRPINSLINDKFGFTKYAYVLAHTIATAETPMTLGIHGEWGSGKSSLAKLIIHFLTPRGKEWNENETLQNIRDDLEKSGHDLDEKLPNKTLNSIEIIELNAWQYKSAQALWRSVILQLALCLENDGFDVSTSDWQRRLYYSVSFEEKGEIEIDAMSTLIAFFKALVTYLAIIFWPPNWAFFLLRLIGIINPEHLVLFSFDDLLERQRYSFAKKQIESIEEFQFVFKELIEIILNNQSDKSNTKNRAVIFIDDLDRCLPQVSLEIMETIKTFLDVPGCAFVLLCDQQLLGQGVKIKFKDLYQRDDELYKLRGKEYIEKIIQVSFQIPSPSQEHMRAYALEALKNTFNKENIVYFDIVYSTVSNNPRKIKRLCLGLEVAFDMMQIGLSSREPISTSTEGTTGNDIDADYNPGNSTTSNKDNISLKDIKKEFAKVYCLQYGWPDAISHLIAHLESNPNQEPYYVPGAVNAKIDYYRSYNVSRMAKPADSEFDISKEISESKNLIEVIEELKNMHQKIPDLVIFKDLLYSVEWEKAEILGKNSINRINGAFWRFLQTPPNFTQMSPENLKNYVEWSSIISGEDITGKISTIKIMNTPIEELDLSVSTFKALKNAGINTVGDVLEKIGANRDSILAIRKFGEKSMEELTQAMEEKFNL
ncbi:MAG: hypothetical protein JXB49_29380 [Bacteroidales bacterium]|nr:hypothetical protein [Bacteroidales bacterium]